MTLTTALMLFGIAMLAGALNAVAGGGSLFTFPALIFAGVSPILANTTSTVSLWTGSLTSVIAYRREIHRAPYKRLLAIISLLGGAAGALLLLHISAKIFQGLVPFLILTATILFTVQQPVLQYVQRTRSRAMSVNQRLMLLGIAQFVIAIYGGFFGGGIGLMMLASLGFVGISDLRIANGLKTLLACIVNGAAASLFIVSKAVLWPQALIMIGGAVIGGYFGAVVARRIRQSYLRMFIIVTGCLLTLYFLLHRQ